MKIILSYHAKKRMIERGIKFEEIEYTITIPDYTITKNINKEAYKRIRGKTLKVVYLEEDKYINVITLIWK